MRTSLSQSYHTAPAAPAVVRPPRLEDLDHVELVVVPVVFNVGLVEHTVVVLIHLEDNMEDYPNNMEDYPNNMGDYV